MKVRVVRVEVQRPDYAAAEGKVFRLHTVTEVKWVDTDSSDEMTAFKNRLHDRFRGLDSDATTKEPRLTAVKPVKTIMASGYKGGMAEKFFWMFSGCYCIYDNKSNENSVDAEARIILSIKMLPPHAQGEPTSKKNKGIGIRVNGIGFNV